MELRQSGPALWTELAEAFEEKEFLRKLGMNRADAERVFASADWDRRALHPHPQPNLLRRSGGRLPPSADVPGA